MARVLVPDELWSRIEPLLPPRRPHKKGGRPWCSDRAARGGILLALRTGLPWEDLPQELGCSGMTCWRRLRDWKKAGVLERLQHDVLGELGRKGRVDWSRASAKEGLNQPKSSELSSTWTVRDKERGAPFDAVQRRPRQQDCPLSIALEVGL